MIIRDDEALTSRVKELAPEYLWDVESHEVENEDKKTEIVLICRKKFWSILE